MHIKMHFHIKIEIHGKSFELLQASFLLPNQFLKLEKLKQKHLREIDTFFFRNWKKENVRLFLLIFDIEICNYALNNTKTTFCFWYYSIIQFNLVTILIQIKGNSKRYIFENFLNIARCKIQHNYKHWE